MARTLVLLTRGPRKNQIIEADDAELTRLEDEEGAKDFRGRDAMRADGIDDFATEEQSGYRTRELRPRPAPPPAPAKEPDEPIDPSSDEPPKGRGPRHGRT